jgi:hypothetical protein
MIWLFVLLLMMAIKAPEWLYWVWIAIIAGRFIMGEIWGRS